MKKLIILSFALFLATLNFAQQDSTDYVDPNYKAEKAKAPKSKQPMSNRMYFGGTFGLSFGSNSSSVLLEPMVGFRMTEKLSTGVGIGYEYGQGENYYKKSYSYSNYLGRVFSRYVIIPKIYAHVEYMVKSYDKKFKFESQNQLLENTSRTTVPFLFVGGGFRSPAGRGFLVVQVLFNVLQNNANSSEVYPSGFPYISIGYMGGF